jgi:hypothetical protein
MLHKIVAIYDTKAEAFSQPVFVQSHGAAVRSFSDQVNGGGDNNLANHPEDFTLFAFGEFDDSTGVFTIDKAPIELAKAIALVESAV